MKRYIARFYDFKKKGINIETKQKNKANNYKTRDWITDFSPS